MSNFKSFLLNEERSYLGHRVGDILTSMQDLQGDMDNLGSRHLAKLADEIVNQIRKILHSSWTPKNQDHLKDLQRIGVALKKSIEEEGDVKDILPMVTSAMQNLSGKLGVKVNNLQAPEQEQGEPITQQDFQLTGMGPQSNQQPGQPQQQMQPGQPQQQMQPGQPQS